MLSIDGSEQAAPLPPSSLPGPAVHESGTASLDSPAPRPLANPIEVQRYLGGVDYPALKSDLLARAQERQAPQAVLSALSQLPETTYRNVTEVTRELGRLAPSVPRAASDFPSPAYVLAYLKGLSFPAGKSAILNLAARNHAPDEILRALEQIPDQSYARVVDINKELRRMR